MPDKKDYDEYVVKVKRQNDKGEDLTGDDVGSGGRRREDGTLSAQYYDPRPYKPMEEAPPYYSDPPAPQRSELSSGQRMLVDTASNALSDIVVRLIEDVVIPAVQRRWKEKFVPGAKRFYHRIMDKKTSTTTSQKQTRKASPQQTSQPQIIISKVSQALRNYRQDMSDEEKQAHLIRIAYHHTCLVHEMQIMKDIPVSDEDWNKALRWLASTQMTDAINLILSGNPALLSAEQGKTLSDIFGAEIMVDGVFVPIKNENVKAALLMSEQ